MLIILLWLLGAAQAEPSGAVAGRIFEGGRGGTVVVLEQAPPAGRAARRYTATLNGRGEYRVFGIAPGRYRVFATTLRGDDDVVRWGIMLPVAHAEIEITGGEDLTGADFILPKAFFTVSGRLGASPETSPSTSLALVDVTQPDARLWLRLLPAGGEFEITGVVPGSYELRPSRLNGDALPFAVAFSVAASNVTGLRVGPDAAPVPESRTSTAPAVAPVSGPIGSASGRVVDADTGTPLAGVVVAAQQGNTTKTDADGRYLLRGIPAGTAQVAVNDGLLWPGLNVPRQVPIAADRETSDVDFRVRLFGSISGRVLTDTGEPVVGARVFVIRREYGHAGTTGLKLATGTLQYFAQATAVTDDRGRYEFERVYAGRQYWLLAYRPRIVLSPAERVPDDAPRPRALAATYHPSSLSLEAALPLTLRSQERREFVDIQMRSTAPRCADAVLARNGTPGSITFRVEEEDVARLEQIAGSLVTPAWRQAGLSAADGRARVCGLAEGRYRLTAESATVSRRELAGSVTFDVADRDVNLGDVDARPPVQIAGRILWDVPRDAAPPSFALALTAFPAPVVARNPPVPADFTFTAFPGRYGLAVTGLAHPFYVKDVAMGQASVINSSVVIGPGPGQSLTMTLGADAGSVAARVIDASGRPVAQAGVLIVSDAPQGGAPLVIVRAGYTDAEGAYRADGIAPGQYVVLGVETLPPAIIYRPSPEMHVEQSPEVLDAIARARGRGQRVMVGPSATASVTVGVIALQ